MSIAMLFAEILNQWTTAALLMGMVMIVMVGQLLVVIKCYKKLRPGHALVRTGVGGSQVSTNAMFVMPFIHQAEYVDLTVKRVDVVCQCENALRLANGEAADVAIAVYVGVESAPNEILHATRELSAAALRDEDKVAAYLQGPCATSLRTLARRYTFKQVNESREEFCLAAKDALEQELASYWHVHTVSIETIQPAKFVPSNGQS